MAELNTDSGKEKKGKSKKLGSGVDLTAMVDLAFLLITFFMLTTTLSKPQSMNLAMPDKSDKSARNETKVSDRRTLTLLLGTDNKLVWYMGQTAKPLDGPTVTGYGKNGLRQVLLDKNSQVLARTQDPERGLIVIIKPSNKSLYHNLVDALDEMAITKVKTYAIVEITPEDLELLDKEGLNGEQEQSKGVN
ncbi:MAG: biopolymer transporter ExbD [Prevotellaceae bacterium]|jgi:biopolymer transport protein ExbD|nr:biopolymer transporter ExbD [Prevotellaceae bacterium]